MDRSKKNRPGVKITPRIREDRYVRVAPGNLDYIKYGRFDTATGRRARKYRMTLLERAAALGRRFNEPVEIFFRSRHARLKVREVIKGVAGQKVKLNDGRELPVRVISSIRYKRKNG